VEAGAGGGSGQRLVFLGGTAGHNPWRKELLRQLDALGAPTARCFDPVVADWTDEVRAREEQVKRDASLLVFYLGDPREPGNPVSAYSLLEAALAVCNDPERTLLIFDLEGVGDHARRQLEQSERLLRAQNPRVPVLHSLQEAAGRIAEHLADPQGSPGSPRRTR
jgi:hypothetical protein